MKRELKGMFDEATGVHADIARAIPMKRELKVREQVHLGLEGVIARAIPMKRELKGNRFIARHGYRGQSQGLSR
jgi:hypothetical protein